MTSLPKPSLFIDIDGCIAEYDPDVITCQKPMTLLPGSLARLSEWHAQGYHIILTTGRLAHRRGATERQLHEAGVTYDQLIMGLDGGVRILINDTKPDGTITAKAYSLPRNAGLGEVNE